MSNFSSNGSYYKDDFSDSQELLELVASWGKSSRSNDSDIVHKDVQIEFSDDLTNYIRTGVDPTGRYSKPPTRRENLGYALGYAFIILMFLVGLVGGG